MATGLLLNKRILGSSSNGRPISVTGTTATAGTTIHTCVTGVGTGVGDEVVLWAQNLATTVRRLNIYLGGTASRDRTSFDLQPSEYAPVAMGIFFNGGKVIRATATAASAINVSGYVIRRS